MCKHDQTRRQFLRTASMASMAGIYVPAHFFWSLTRWPRWRRAGTHRLPALVCVYLQGGNDGHGTVIATDPDSYRRIHRGALGRARTRLSDERDCCPSRSRRRRPAAPSRSTRALTGMQNLFNAGRAAIVANTGTLVAPATKAQIKANSVPLPDSLFSHFDQTAAWQAIASNLGSGEHVGWGGAVADAIESHEHEFELHVHLHLDCRQRALPLRTNLVPAQRHAGRSDSDLRPGAAAVRQLGADQPAQLDPQRRRDTTSSPRSTKSSSSARSQAQAHAGTARWLPAGAGGVPNPPQFLDPMTNKLADNPLGRIAADRGPHHRRTRRPRRHASDLLRAARQLRHARRPGQYSTRTCSRSWARRSSTSTA